MRNLFFISLVLEVQVCPRHHLLAPGRARKYRGSCPSRVHAVATQPQTTSHLMFAHHGFLQHNMIKNQITTTSETDCLLFCLNWWRVFLTLHLTESRCNQLHLSCVTITQVQSVPQQHIMWTSEHAAGDRSGWEQHLEGPLSIPPVCPLNVVTRVQFSCSSLRMVTWPDWSPMNTCRVSTSNLSCKH